MTRFGSWVVLCAMVFGCPKNLATTVAGTDDQQMDQYASVLEEYRTKSDLSCADWCSAKQKVCGISASVCELSSKATERHDFQSKCVSAQEDCAKFGESCASCLAK
jgi:hypothetical protein